MSKNNLVRLPTSEEVEVAKESSRTLSKYADDERINLKIISENGDQEEIILPGQAMNMLLKVLTEMAQGNAISVVPVHAELTTQEAANFLNVSRPFLIKLIESQKIKCRRVGTHRRVRLSDLIKFKQEEGVRQDDAMDKLVQQAQDLNLGYE